MGIGPPLSRCYAQCRASIINRASGARYGSYEGSDSGIFGPKQFDRQVTITKGVESHNAIKLGRLTYVSTPSARCKFCIEGCGPAPCPEAPPTCTLHLPAYLIGPRIVCTQCYRQGYGKDTHLFLDSLIEVPRSRLEFIVVSTKRQSSLL